MDKDYLFRYGIALHLLNNNVDGWEYIESLNENEYRDLHKQFNQLAKFRGLIYKYCV